MIKIDSVTKRYDNILAVDRLSLGIPAHERTVILGHSGCGKTTLLRLIAGLEIPDEGKIVIDGKLASDTRIILEPRERELGMIFQDLALWPHLTLAENILFGLKKSYRHKPDPQRETQAMLAIVGLRKSQDIFPAQLSGGEQQRLALARALIRKPKILLMDEPLANLDQGSKEQLVNMIVDLQIQTKITMVYVTHDLSSVEQLAQHTVIMREGKIDQMTQQQKVPV